MVVVTCSATAVFSGADEEEGRACSGSCATIGGGTSVDGTAFSDDDGGVGNDASAAWTGGAKLVVPPGGCTCCDATLAVLPDVDAGVLSAGGGELCGGWGEDGSGLAVSDCEVF